MLPKLNLFSHEVLLALKHTSLLLTIPRINCPRTFITPLPKAFSTAALAVTAIELEERWMYICDATNSTKMAGPGNNGGPAYREIRD